MRILPLLIASAAVLYSCDKKQATSTETAEVTAPMNDSATIAVENSNGELVAQDNSTGELAAQDVTAVAANNSSNKPALNPEHGQPYHRCEIPVGAPIDSAPSQNAAPQLVPQQSPANNSFNTNPISPSLAPSPAPAQAIGSKPANNPEHGQPHHRCDLEVGAPLI